MVMTFILTPLSCYNSITKPHAQFLLSLLKALFIDFLSHFIISIIDVYNDMMTCDKLIFSSTITQILHHFSILISDSRFYIIMGSISAAFVRRSEAQLRQSGHRPR